MQETEPPRTHSRRWSRTTPWKATRRGARGPWRGGGRRGLCAVVIRLREVDDIAAGHRREHAVEGDDVDCRGGGSAVSKSEAPDDATGGCVDLIIDRVESMVKFQ